MNTIDTFKYTIYKYVLHIYIYIYIYLYICVYACVHYFKLEIENLMCAKN